MDDVQRLILLELMDDGIDYNAIGAAILELSEPLDIVEPAPVNNQQYKKKVKQPGIIRRKYRINKMKKNSKQLPIITKKEETNNRQYKKVKQSGIIRRNQEINKIKENGKQLPVVSTSAHVSTEVDTGQMAST